MYNFQKQLRYLGVMRIWPIFSPPYLHRYLHSQWYNSRFIHKSTRTSATIRENWHVRKLLKVDMDIKVYVHVRLKFHPCLTDFAWRIRNNFSRDSYKVALIWDRYIPRVGGWVGGRWMIKSQFYVSRCKYVWNISEISGQYLLIFSHLFIIHIAPRRSCDLYISVRFYGY